jgi:superfamily II DNA/RNA helicase
MKKCVFISLVALIGCVSSGYKTIYTLEQSVRTAYEGYCSLVIQGKVPTNDVPRVSRAFNDFQASALVATDLVQNNTNALAPQSLVTEGQDVINLISVIKKGK